MLTDFIYLFIFTILIQSQGDCYLENLLIIYKIKNFIVNFYLLRTDIVSPMKFILTAYMIFLLFAEIFMAKPVEFLASFITVVNSSTS